MATPRRVVVIGSTGVFGRLLVSELKARGDLDAVPAARRDASLHVDLNDLASVRRAAEGAFAIACAAGPFQSFDRRAVREAVDAGAHWLDIADDPHWFFGILDDSELDDLAKRRGVIVVSGLSTFPAVSGALVRRLRTRTPAAREAKVTLWIGNRNAKGAASIASALASGGERLTTPDAELLRRELDIAATAAVRFQAPAATGLFRLIGGIRSERSRRRIGRIVSAISAPLNRFGTDRSALRVEMGGERDEVQSRGQRLAILPLVFALDRLLAGSLEETGCISPAQATDGASLLKFLEESV